MADGHLVLLPMHKLTKGQPTSNNKFQLCPMLLVFAVSGQIPASNDHMILASWCLHAAFKVIPTAPLIRTPTAQTGAEGDRCSKHCTLCDKVSIEDLASSRSTQLDPVQRTERTSHRFLDPFKTRSGAAGAKRHSYCKRNTVEISNRAISQDLQHY